MTSNDTLILSLAELECKINKSKKFEAYNSSFWEPFEPDKALVSDVRKMVRERRLRVVEDPRLFTIMISVSEEDCLVNRIYVGTMDEVISQFDRTNFELRIKWSKLIDRATGEVIKIYQQ